MLPSTLIRAEVLIQHYTVFDIRHFITQLITRNTMAGRVAISLRYYDEAHNSCDTTKCYRLVDKLFVV